MRVDDVEVVRAGDEMDRTAAGGLPYLGGPSLRQAWRDLVVVRALDDGLQADQRQEVAGVAGLVAVGHGSGLAAHQVLDPGAIVSEGAGCELEQQTEINCGGESEDAAQGDARLWMVEHGAFRDVRAAGQPEGEMAAGGVTGRDDSVKI